MIEPELDLVKAAVRRDRAAENAKRLEEHGDGWAALEAWKEYELISAAIEAQKRSLQAAERARSGSVAPATERCWCQPRRACCSPSWGARGSPM